MDLGPEMSEWCQITIIVNPFQRHWKERRFISNIFQLDKQFSLARFFATILGCTYSWLFNTEKKKILIGFLEWSECDSQNDCIDDLFNNLLETDPKLEFPIFENFEDLFSRGLFEHLSFDMTSNEIRNVFQKIFKNSEQG